MGLSHVHNCMVTLQLNLGQSFPQFSSPTSAGIYITGRMPFLSPSHRSVSRHYTTKYLLPYPLRYLFTAEPLTPVHRMMTN